MKPEDGKRVLRAVREHPEWESLRKQGWSIAWSGSGESEPDLYPGWPRIMWTDPNNPTALSHRSPYEAAVRSWLIGLGFEVSSASDDATVLRLHLLAAPSRPRGWVPR